MENTVYDPEKREEYIYDPETLNLNIFKKNISSKNKQSDQFVYNMQPYIDLDEQLGYYWNK